eukprot:2167237-Pleurochrysis_carterae.AAC.2
MQPTVIRAEQSTACCVRFGLLGKARLTVRVPELGGDTARRARRGDTPHCTERPARIVRAPPCEEK